MMIGQAQRIATAPGDLSEADLVAAARNGEEEAVRELVRRLNPRLFRIARGIVDSDAVAEEVVQEAYLAGFTRLGSFRGEARFSTWMTRIVINAARMHHRRTKPFRRSETEVEEALESGQVLVFPAASRPDEAYGQGQMREVLEAAVTELPSELRLPFLMHEVEGMSVREIAEHLQLNPITVKTRMFRARRRLRASIEARMHGGFEALFPFDGARCAALTDRVVAELKRRGNLR